MLKPGFHPSCATLSSYTIKLKRRKQSLSVLPLCSNTQKHLGKNQDFRIKLQAGGCPFSFPAAAMPPQRQFLSPAPCRLYCFETVVLGAMAFITEDAASLQSHLLQSHRKRLSLLTVP